MSKEEILEKAIYRAKDNGWDYLAFEYKDEPGFTKKSHERYDEIRQTFITDWQSDTPAYQLIFDHNFAKALWGEKEYPAPEVPSEGTYYNQNSGTHIPIWQYHLQQMVISEDPIKYLGDNI